MEKVFVLGRDAVPERFELRAGERLKLTLVALPGVSADVPVRVELLGEGAELDAAGLYLCLGDERVNIRMDVRHNVGGCTSRQLFKGIVGGTARSDFYGLIYVARDAQRTEAYQENHNLLLSDEAWALTKPQLEIYADDVACSHGATVGRLNADELFYMRSRGIPEAEARALQMISFLSPVLARIPDEALVAEILRSLENR